MTVDKNPAKIYHKNGEF